MKRLPLLGLVLALASCGSSIDDGAQGVACYDTGSGMKCVPLDELPSNAQVVCVDTDGEVQTSQSSDPGPSPSDNDTSESSDAPGANLLPTGGDDSDSAGDLSGNSISSAADCGGGTATDGEDSNSGEDTDGDGNSDSSSDADGDGTDDSQDCDCIDPDGPPTGDPGGPIIN